MTIKLSIIIPSFNPKKSFFSNLSKIDKFCKSRKDVEIIIIDDFSYKKIEINKKLDSKLHIIRNKDNYGPGISRNIGIKKSTGEYILFLDSDDILSKNSVNKIFDYLNKYKNVQLFGYDHKLILNKKEFFFKNDDKFILSKSKILRNFLSASTNPSAIFYVFKKKFLIKNNIYFKKGMHEDILFMFKVFYYVKKKMYIKNTLYIKYNNNNSIINNIDEKRIIEYFKALRDIFKFYSKLSYKQNHNSIEKYYHKGQSGYIFQIIYFIINKKLPYRRSINLLFYTYKIARRLFDIEKLPKKTKIDRIVDIYLNEIKYIYDRKYYQKFCEKINKNLYGKT